MGAARAKLVQAEERLEDKIRAILAELRDEYRQLHSYPWIIGYSGGKDSTLVTHLVFAMLQGLAPRERRRPVHIVANDTLVESPLVVQHLDQSLKQIGAAAEAFGLPIEVAVTRPDANHTFWVNLIGRGYPSPNRTFRWCTDRMKILPTSRYIKERACEAGQVILLLGVRRSESATRSATVARYDNGGRLNRHNDLAGCLVFRPIVDLTTDEVWELLGSEVPPWGGSYRGLIKLYRDAGGGECPVVTQKTDVPSCGTSSSRFGCWTCTVVEKDRSLEGFVDAGFHEFGPLLNFRDWLVEIRNDPKRRLARRRGGRITITAGGTFVPGPFAMKTRAEILRRLLKLQQKVEMQLISEEEVALIKKIWAEDVTATAVEQSW